MTSEIISINESGLFNLNVHINMNSLKLLFTSLIFSLQEKEFVRMGQSLQVRKYVFYKSDLCVGSGIRLFQGRLCA